MRPSIVPWVLSGADRGSIADQARDLRAYLESHPEADVAAVGYTLLEEPPRLGHRVVITGKTAEDFRRALEALESGTPAANLFEGVAERAEEVVFAFPPHGPQFAGMGRELLDASDTFRDRMRECERALEPFVDWSLVDVLQGEDETWAEHADFVQPALFAISVSIAHLMRACGVEPAAVLGHSIGEVPAAHFAGGLSIEDAARIEARWSIAQETLRGRGGMLSVQLSPADTEGYLQRWPGQLEIAAHNGPLLTIVSGDIEPVEELLEELERDEVRVQRISISFAAHSHHIDAIHERMLSDLAPIVPREGSLPFYSSAAGGPFDTIGCDSAFFPRALREVALFDEAVRAAVADGRRVFVEVSPHPALTFGIRQTLETIGEGVAISTLKRDQGGMERIWGAVAQAWVHGAAVDWRAAFGGEEHERVEIPRGAPSDDAERRETLKGRVLSAPEGEREALVLRIVRSQVAAALGLDGPDEVSPTHAFKDLGVDSASVVELAEGLNKLLELRLPATVAFEHPTATELAERALAEAMGVTPSATRGAAPIAAALDEPIAIVGIGCRFPGEAGSAEDLWRIVDSGTDAIGRFPDDRGWDLERLYDPDPDQPGTCYIREGGFIYDAPEFDAGFFGITPREAGAMDPQQRLLLQVAWEALEDAGIDPTALRGSATGVFAGVFPQEYGPRLHKATEATAGYSLTGSLTSLVSGRVAYSFGFEGPAVSVDTACSSSLVAMHQACVALRQGECPLALAGGVTVLSTPGLLVEFSRQRGLATDARCKSFAAAADGTGFSEGVGMVVLERLSDAQRLGHEVLAVVRGSAVNQDGASNGLTAPSGPSQERVIMQALANAKLSPADVDVVEAHGTGTRLGDPIEAGALLATYGQERADGQPLWLGSLKSNIGHTNAAAGVAGAIKMVMAMRHERLPATLHVDEPTPHVNWTAGSVELVREPVEWSRGERVRRAGVSSFGISGTNAHMILEEPPAVEREDEPQAVEGPLPFLVSAASADALGAQAERLASWLEERPEVEPYEVACALALRRAHLPHRGVAVAGDRAELIAALRALEGGAVRDGATAFLFTGQGAQWVGMGAELYEAFPVFAEALDAVCAGFDHPLRELMFSGDSEKLSLTEFTQASLFAIEVALFRLFESWGVKPDFLVGHSIGELSAAHVAGVLSLEDACKLVSARGRLMGALPEGGAMLAIEATEEEIQSTLSDHLSLAAVNAPRAVVVSGTEEAVEAAAQQWSERKTKRLQVSHAFHSHLMEPMLDEFRAVAESINYEAPQIPVVGADVTDPGYWVRQVREPVRFAAAIEELQGLGATRFFEIGPDGVLSAMAPDCTPAMRKNRDQSHQLVTCLGAMHTAGVEVDWSKLLDATGLPRVELPTYAFQPQRYWIEDPDGLGDLSAAGQSSAEHPLLGAAVRLAGDQEGWLFTGRISLKSHPWIADHAVADVVLLPGTAFVELGLAVAERVGAGGLDDLTLVAPLVLEGDGAVGLQVTVGESDEDGRSPVNIYSSRQGESGNEDWVLHASGLLGAADEQPADDGALAAFAAAEWPPDADEFDLDGVYGRLSASGYDYGPVFQGLRAAYRAGDDEWYAEVALGADQQGQASGFSIHPALSDSALHTMLLEALERREPGDPPEVPLSFSGVRVHREAATALRVRVDVLQGDDSDGDATIVRLLALDETGAPAFAIESLKMRAVDQASLRAQATSGGSDSLLWLEWVKADSGSDASALTAALLGGEASDDLGVELETAGVELARYPDLEALEEMVEAGVPVPSVVLLPIGRPDESGGGLAASVNDLTERSLRQVQAWLESESLAEAKLVFVTAGALAVEPGESPNLPQAALLGLIRSAGTENPGRIGVIDLDSPEASGSALPRALASDEPELALRDGRVLAARLARANADERTSAEQPDPNGTILITGGTGGLGALVARHLATEHSARRLLLASRRGPESEGAQELIAGLAESGCEAEAVACDAADRGQLEGLLAGIPQEHPLTAVIHCAGVLDDGVIGSLDGDQLRRVMAPKVDGAINLHELTEELGLSQFVMFSSAAGTLGTPGQANYAAANAFLDALADHRRAHGLPATALAWGPWERSDGMLGDLNKIDVERWERAGVSALSDEQGLALLDTARATEHPRFMPVRLNSAALRAQAKAGTLPQVFRGLFRTAARHGSEAQGSLAARLASASESDSLAIVLDLVQSLVASVIGHASAEVIDPQRAFKELGFDSLSAVELRNRLSDATGLTLPTTLVFDHASPAAVAEFLRSKVAGTQTAKQSTRSSRARIDEPIAIVGMSARYPGGVRSPEDLWQLVVGGEDAIGDFPTDRGWDLDHLFDPDPDNPGTSISRNGGFLYDAGEFDSDFFTISPREALAVDPQHRLMLEGAWEALEDASIDPSSLRGSQTGVFTGIMYADYASDGVPAELEGFMGTGASMLSGRISYTFGFEGPAVSVDTACSSSLVAIHLACQALRQGECDLALAGGVTLLSTPTVFVQFSRQRALSPDGRCKSYSASADGVGWSEGAGLLVLEPLSQAQANGHEVLALVRGSAVNQDGASNGLTAPNGPSQERVIRQALDSAGLSPTDVDAVEGHGTGTTLGDPIEAQALIAAYGQNRTSGPLYIGSVKSNIGHTLAAAGVAGVIKMVKALRNGLLPRSLHCDEPSPHVDWSAGEVEPLHAPVDWSPGERVRRAGVSSFGVSGTNSHLILEEAPPAEAPTGSAAAPPVLPLVVSARGEPALREQARRLADWLVEHEDLEPSDIAFSLATGRAQLERRAVVVGGSRDELVARLGALSRGEPSDGVVTGEARGGKAVFVFPGQGSQWEGMALDLIDSAPVFAESMRACGEALSQYVDWSLDDVLRGAEGAPSLDRVDVVQPALWAVMVSLAALWRSFGVEPAAVVGHSQGEIAAAYVAGGLSLDDAARVVALRSQAVRDGLAGHGGMGSIALAPEAAEERLEQWGDRLSLAAINGPDSVVVSGEMEALDELLAACEEDGIWARKIPVDYPSHSVRVEALRERIESDLADIAPVTGEVPFFSTVTAEVMDTAGLDGEYWYRSLRNRVRFNDVVEALIEDRAGAFLEMSPNPGLTIGIAAAADSAGAADRVVAVGSLRRGEGGLDRFLTSLAEAHVHGVPVDWTRLYEGTGARLVDLPTYAFQRERYWLEMGGGGGVGDLAAAGLGVVDHPLLSAMLASPGAHGTSFTGRISLAAQPWLADHAVFDRVLFPATAFAELALSAAAELGCGTVDELTLEAPLVLAEGAEVALQVVVGEDDGGGRREVEVYSRGRVEAGDDDEPAEWVRHASGTVSDEPAAPADAVRRLGEESWPPAGAEAVDVASMYDRLADTGFGYGPAFQGAVAAWRRGNETFCEVALGDDVDQTGGFGVHPALLDSSFHAMLDGLDSDGAGVPLPFSLSGVRVHSAGAPSLRVALTTADDGSAVSLAAVDESGQPVLEIESLAMRPIDAARLGAAARPGGDSLFRHDWVELALDAAEGAAGRYAVVGDGLELADDVPSYADLDALVAAAEGDAETPEVVFATAPASDGDGAEAARAGVTGLLRFVQAWIAADALRDARLVLVTRGAMCVTDGEAPDPAAAALWGLMRSAQSEHPGRFVLVDLGEHEDATALDWPALLDADEPQLAVRRGGAYALRVARLRSSKALVAPEGVQAWHLAAPDKGTLEALTLVESQRAQEPLGPGEVRIAMRAGGVNFRDVLIALGQYPDDDPIGSEGAGVVLEVGEEVTDLAAGDPVMGLVPDALGPVAVTDRRLVAPVPKGWSYAEAASVPIVFMTAYYGLVELGGLSEGQTVLVHAGAGGVGMAAIQIARHLGAEVYATASPAKWDVLRGLGLDDDHIASSRDLDFRDRFLKATGDKGVDVVLNALAHEYVDASLALLPRGGRFVEMGKADIRDADQVARDHAGVEYRQYDLVRGAGTERVGEMLAEVLALFEQGALERLPIRAWDVRHAPEAFRYLGDGRNVGKVVLTIPRALDPEGTVLITGGMGDLGQRVARHLAGEHGVRKLLLVSRRGMDSPGAAEFVEELRELGAEGEVAACDVTDREQLAALISSRDLTAVVHTAGVLDDGVIESLTAEQIEKVLRPKVDAGLLLDELTRDLDLAEFVLFSSDSGTVGVPGQGNYAAANVFLDALAERRRAQALPAKSLAWGLWSNATGMAGQLGEADIARLARLGVAAMSDELDLFDTARASAETVVVPTRLDMPGLRAAAEAGTLPALMRDIVRSRARRGRDTGVTLEQQLASVPEDEREAAVVNVIREQAAAVLGHSSPDSVDAKRKFKELGFDSLGAVELRNRLAQVSGMRLPSTLIFDHPSPLAVARYLMEKLSPPPPTNGEASGQAGEAEIRRVLASISMDKLRSAGLLDTLVKLADSNGDDNGDGDGGDGGDSQDGDETASVDDLDVDELVRMAEPTQ